MTAKVTADAVTIEPSKIGAGLANITFTNLSNDPVELTFDGPSSAASQIVKAGNVSTMKVLLEEGDYSVSAGGESAATPDRLTVGPERRSSQNDLLLP